MRYLPLTFCVLSLPVASLATTAIQTLPDFQLSVVAATPVLPNPIAIDWDASGRMWVAATPDNPLKARGFAARDSILILEDSNSDGVIDKNHVFAHRLRGIGTFAFHRDGVIVAEGPNIVWLRDKNADGMAETRQVLFTGFGDRIEPARLMSFRRGLDGWIYGVVGGNGEEPNNIKGAERTLRNIGPGIFRFKPDGSSIESVSTFAASAASIDFSWDGELFFSQANGPHAAHVGLPESFFVAKSIGGAASCRKIEDHQTVLLSAKNGNGRERFVTTSPGISFTTPLGAAIYEGGAWPERYRENYYVADPDLHVIHEDVLSRSESAYFEATRRLAGEFASATNGAFNPFELRVGPDGAMYILDCQSRTNTPSEHSPRMRGLHAAYETSDGRIWRLQHKQARKLPASALAGEWLHDVVRGLEHPNKWSRETALRLIVERSDPAAVMSLEKLSTSSRFPHARVAALWALHHLNALSHGVWTNLVHDAHSGVQKNAWLAFIEANRAMTPEIEAIAIKQAKEGDERVRLAALRALAKGPITAGGRESIAKLFPDLKDNWSKTIVLAIARPHPMEFIRVAFASDKSDKFRELVVPLVEQVSSEPAAISTVLEITAKHAEKTEKLTSAVRETLAKTVASQ